MARYTGPSCRQCRREGTKLFLKGTKCFTEKCPVERRPYAPGQHGQSDGAPQEGVRVRQAAAREAEDQAHVRHEREAVPQHVRARSRRMPGITGHNLLAALESRLDNVVYRMGFAPAARRRVSSFATATSRSSGKHPRHPVLPGAARARKCACGRSRASWCSCMAAMEQAARGAVALVARGGQGVVQRPDAREPAAHRASRWRRRNSWSSSCTRSKPWTGRLGDGSVRAGRCTTVDAFRCGTSSRTVGTLTPLRALPRVRGGAKRRRATFGPT